MDPKALKFGRELGAGAVARVLEATSADGRVFAVKVLHTSRDLDPHAALRFAREAELLGQLEHPNIVGVYGQTTVDEHPAMLMELVDGPALDVLLAREAPLPTQRVIALARGIAAGLAAAHEAGVVHRDLKPANVLVAAGDTAKIADFGLARASSFAGVDGSDFAILGTPDYMAPEAVDPLAVDARSDLYALGCIVFEMMTGAPPFTGATAFGVIERHRTAPVPEIPPAAGYPPALTRLLARLLEKQPADRPQSAHAVVSDLDALERSPSLDDRPTLVPTTPSGAGRCPRCGAPTVAALDVCLSCRLPIPRIAPGRHTVFVTGPGEIGDKLDSTLRSKLLEWIASNPSLGLQTSALAKTIPRLPFVLATGIDERSGEALVAALRSLGLQATCTLGGRTALPAMRKKVRIMGGRALAIVLASSIYISSSLDQALWWWIPYLVVLFAVPGGVGAKALAAVTRPRGNPLPLPPALQERMIGIASVAGALTTRRQREALRAVVQRTLELRELIPAAQRPVHDPELEQALDIALVAAGRLDEIDRRLEHADLRQPSGEVHALMRERDTWSSRLLDLTATLEGLRARVAAAAARSHDDEREQLEGLRAKIEALEEVQRA